MNTTESKEKAMDMAIALIFVLILIISLFISYFPGNRGAASSVSPFMVLIPDNVSEVSINEYAGVQKKYTFDLSNASVSDNSSCVFVYLHHTMAVLDIDGMVIADTRETHDRWHIGHTPGSYWLKIPIRKEYYGKEMSVTLIPAYNSVVNESPEFFVIDRQMLIHSILLPREGLILVLGTFSVTIGFFLILLSLMLGLHKKDRRQVFFFGAIAVTAGFWKLSGLSILPLLFDYYGKHKLLWYFGTMSYMLMLVLSLRLIDVLHGETNNLISRICCQLSLSILSLVLILQILGVIDIHEIVIPYGIIMGLLHLLTLLQNPRNSELLWLIPSFIALVIDGLILLNTGIIHDAPLLISWIILNLFIRGFWYLRRSVLQEKLLIQKEAELNDIKIQNMISQIRPHFIYNTLASINMICDSDPKRAMELTSNFNNYLQHNFTAIEVKQPVPFTTEYEHTKAYLSVETALYTDKLKVIFDTDYVDFSLPPLTLQPVVENSIKHGIGTTHKPETITIRSRKVSGGAEITVEDDGPGINCIDIDKPHVGLKNVSQRLQLMCNGKISFSPRPEGGTVVTIFVEQACHSPLTYR